MIILHRMLILMCLISNYVHILSEIMTEADKFKVFQDWLIENGARFPKLTLKDYGNEVRGSHSQMGIENDEIVLEIPFRCLITVEMGKETEIGQLVLHSDIELDAPKHTFLMLFMLIDRKNDTSFFKPYYDILPQTLSNMPIFWDEEELSYLKGSFILNQIDERNLAIETDYYAICNISSSFADICTVDEFKWARMAVCSRNFGILAHGLKTAALVPYADMLNHFRPRETKWKFEDKLNAFIVSAIQDIAPGCEVFDSYGQKCNHRFLLNYGFSVENNAEPDGYNPNDVPILLHLSKEDECFHKKVLMWRCDTSGCSKRIRLNLSDSKNTRLALSLLRIIVADNEDFTTMLSMQLTAGTPPPMISSANEKRSLHLLDSICEDYLSRYSNSLEDDIALLSSDALAMYSNHRNAVIQIKGEKEILHVFRRLVLSGITLMECDSQEDLDKHLNHVKTVEHVYVHQYCESLARRVWQKEFDIRQMLLDIVD